MPHAPKMFDMLSVFAFTVRGDQTCRRIPLLDRVPSFVLHSVPLVLRMFFSRPPRPFRTSISGCATRVREEMVVGVHARRITARRITILFYWVVGGGETTSVAAASLARFGSNNLAGRQPGQGVRII